MDSIEVGPERQPPRLYCPANFSPTRTLAKSQRDLSDGLVYLAHTVIMRRVLDPRHKHRDGFVPLASQHIRRILGARHWPRIKQAGVDCGLVECDGSYRAGHRSLGYRLCEPYASAPWELREIHNPRLSRRIDEWRTQRRQRCWDEIRAGKRRVSPEVCEHLYHHLQRIQIDEDIPETLTNESAVAVDMIRRGQWRFDVDDYGRVHTNITNLRRLLRARLTVDGMRLVNCDIANSQPLFIGMRLQPGGKQAGRGEGGRKGQGSGQGSTICCALFGSLGKLSTDIERFIILCGGGKLYRFVESRLGDEMHYATLKRRVLATFYDRDSHRNVFYGILDKEFPMVMRGIRAVKRLDYRHLAHLAQRTESEFIFVRVVSRLLRERPGLFVTTIHDSVMTTAGDEETVKGVMLDEFKKLNIPATVRIER